MLAPAGTPREAITRLHGETVKAIKDPKIAETLKIGRFFVIANTPEEFGAMMREGHAALGTRHPRDRRQGRVARIRAQAGAPWQSLLVPWQTQQG